MWIGKGGTGRRNSKVSEASRSMSGREEKKSGAATAVARTEGPVARANGEERTKGERSYKVGGNGDRRRRHGSGEVKGRLGSDRWESGGDGSEKGASKHRRLTRRRGGRMSSRAERGSRAIDRISAVGDGEMAAFFALRLFS